MDMIWHTVYRNKFVFVVFDNSTNVFVKFIFPNVLDNAILVLDCKNNLNMNLRIGVCHDKMDVSSLRDFKQIYNFTFYRYEVPDGTY